MSYSKQGVDAIDTTCQRSWMKPRQSLFSLILNASTTSGLRLPRSHVSLLVLRATQQRGRDSVRSLNLRGSAHPFHPSPRIAPRGATRGYDAHNLVPWVVSLPRESTFTREKERGAWERGCDASTLSQKIMMQNTRTSRWTLLNLLDTTAYDPWYSGQYLTVFRSCDWLYP